MFDWLIAIVLSADSAHSHCLQRRFRSSSAFALQLIAAFVIFLLHVDFAADENAKRNIKSLYNFFKLKLGAFF